MDAWSIEQQIIADGRANDRMTKATWGLVLATIGPLEGGSLLTLLALAKQVSFLKTWSHLDPVSADDPGASFRD